MAMGEKVGTIIYKIFQYMKSNPGIDWESDVAVSVSTSIRVSVIKIPLTSHLLAK